MDETRKLWVPRHLAGGLLQLFSAFEQADHRSAGRTGWARHHQEDRAQLMGGDTGFRQRATPSGWPLPCLKKGDGSHGAAVPPRTRDTLRPVYAHLLAGRSHQPEVALTLLEDVGLLIDIAEDAQALASRRYASHGGYADAEHFMDRLEAARGFASLAAHDASRSLAMTACRARRALLRAGMNGFIANPVNPDTLYSLTLLRSSVTPSA